MALRGDHRNRRAGGVYRYWQAEGKVSPYPVAAKAGAQRANQPFQQWRNAADATSANEPDKYIPRGFRGNDERKMMAAT